MQQTDEFVKSIVWMASIHDMHKTLIQPPRSGLTKSNHSDYCDGNGSHKDVGARSYGVAMRRQFLSRPNMFSIL